MKITTSDSIYIQKSDLFSLYKINYPVSKGIKSKIYDSVVLGNNPSTDFVKFDEKEDIELLKTMDWILELDEITNMSLSDINRISEEVIEEQDRIFHSKERIIGPIDRTDILNLKIKSLREALLYKQGLLKIRLPKEIRIIYPQPKKKFYKKNYRKNIVICIIKYICYNTKQLR